MKRRATGEDRRPVRLVTPNDAERRVVRVRAAGFVPVEANLHRPALPDGVVLRGELVDTLREQGDVPVVLVTAPAGYGKTTVVAQWDEEDERPFVWVTLDRTSNDPTVLVIYIMLALQRLQEADTGVLGALADESAVSTVLLPRLGRRLAQQTQPFVLVLDDAESLTSTDSLAVVMTVLQHLSVGSQLVIIAKTPPPLPWSQLRAERRLFALTPSNLGLTLAEALAVLAANGVDLPPREVAELLERTEGWPAGVYLAAVSLRKAAERREAVTHFGGRGSVIADYLRQEVLERLPRQQQTFLVKTSVVQRMSAPLCDAILDTSGSADTLRELERSNVFVVPLDGQEQWYRYHNVFREMLVDELAREDPKERARLHSRASRWFEEVGDLEHAVAHAQAANEVDRAAELVWVEAGLCMATGRVETLRHLLDGFTTQQVVGRTKLALVAGWCAYTTGRPAEPWIAAAEHAALDAATSGETDAMAADRALLRAACARNGVRQMRQDAEQAADLLPPGSPWRVFAQYLQAVAALLGGSPDEARGMLEAAERAAALGSLVLDQALCLAQLALLAIEGNDWELAARLAGTASQLVDDTVTGAGPSAALVPCVTTLVLARQGRRDEAKALAQQSMRVIVVPNDRPAWLAAETRYLLARAHLLMSDTAAARVLFSEAQTQLRASPDAVWLADRLAESWSHVEQFPLATGVGASALTSAELRVLQLLPTHLSFEQISERLSVSRNTVKTQAIAAYRKLGVSSRTEAVERAKSLGLIETPSPLVQSPGSPDLWTNDPGPRRARIALLPGDGSDPV